MSRLFGRGFASLLFLAVTALADETPDLGADEGRFEAVLVNGGGSRRSNFQSHLLHLRELYELLLASDVPPDHITIFSADGTDPRLDVAVRDRSVDAAWQLDGTRLSAKLDPRTTYVNSGVDGAVLKPATKAEIGPWFEAAAERLRPGDTLLLYVTDHGAKNTVDPWNNRITLWGKDENLSVEELREFLGPLDPGVRVVLLMSQCFSGAFANLMEPGTESTEAAAGVCGYFATTEQRPAYGCYPQNYDKQNVGYSFHFIDALRGEPNFSSAQREVLFTDRTPDVPLKTSDVYLERVLESAAKRSGTTLNAFVDRLLLEAWDDKAAWETEIRLLDRIGQAFGFFSPRSLAEIEEAANRLPAVGRAFSRYAGAWQASLDDLNKAVLERFLEARPEWGPRLGAEGLEGLSEDDRRALALELLPEIAYYVQSDTVTSARRELLHRNATDSSAADYRMQVRLGALLRMKTVLARVAGQVYLASRASEDEVREHASLVGCESLALANSVSTPRLLQEQEPFPSFDEDLALAERVLPGWMGVRFRPTRNDVREEMGLETGATDITTVFPDTPAEAAGLEAGDIVLGPPGAPFTERNQIREWVMTGPIGKQRALQIRRGDDELLVVLTPSTYPLEQPALPGPPKAGNEAPPLEQVQAYHGSLPDSLANKGPYLLFFWATWCGPCKQAVPELLAFERKQGIRVIAITDERSAQLEPFFETRGDAFPETVAIDLRRRTFQTYGVSGTPSFVLIGKDGKIRASAAGYSAEKGLDLPGWSWSEDIPQH